MGKLVACALGISILVGCGAPDDADAGDVDSGAADSDASAGTPWLVEDFGTASAQAWPASWSVLGGIAADSVENGRGRLVPTVTAYSLGRMGHALAPAATPDIDVRFTLTMTDPTRQGVGFYVRQNGGYLTQTATHGGGYCVFVEAFRGPQIGLWRERDGTEESLVLVAIPALDANGTYAVHFRATQDGTRTALAAKIWPASAAEPTDWMVTTTDATPALQNISGAIAVDAWNTATPGNGPTPAPIFIDAIVVGQPAQKP